MLSSPLTDITLEFWAFDGSVVLRVGTGGCVWEAGPKSVPEQVDDPWRPPMPPTGEVPVCLRALTLNIEAPQSNRSRGRTKAQQGAEAVRNATRSALPAPAAACRVTGIAMSQNGRLHVVALCSHLTAVTLSCHPQERQTMCTSNVTRTWR